MTLKRTLCALLAASMLTTGLATTAGTANAVEVEKEPSLADLAAQRTGNSYGLADNIQDGVILHCFDWKYNDIKDMIPQIAEAGFTAVQTSPAQRDSSYGVWYMMYQPQGFTVATNALGTKEDLKNLCSVAEEYGVKIVVDVVANHLRGNGYDVDDNMSRGNHPEYWHGNDSGINYGDRYSITHNDLGMADLNSENATVQQIVAGYIDELKGLGVDGCRWDAAKHIGLPSESCNFWPAVTKQGLWHYGEILSEPGPSNGAGLMQEYTKYISVTDSDYCKNVRSAYENGGTAGAIGNWSERGVSKDKLVYWAESHDTYSNDGSYGEASQFVDQNKIDRAYAIIASQSGASALYFSRPGPTSKEQIMAGAKGSTHFTSKEVAAVNHFHNAMVGQAEYYVNENGAAAVCRTGGAVIAKGSGSGQVTISNGGGTVTPGTYTDEITGNEWTVTSTSISGTVGDTGIAVIYDEGSVVSGARVSATPADASFTTATLDVTITAKNATSASYSTSEGDSGSFTDSKKITIGGKTNVTGTSKNITVTVKATGEDGKEVSKTYTYTKSDPSLVTAIYFDNSSYNWSKVYAYVYTESGSVSEMAAWPGVEMSKDSATGYYKLELDEAFENALVIFSDGTNSADKRYPADQEPGIPIGGKSMLFSANHTWEPYTPPVPDDSDTDSDDTDSDDTDSDEPKTKVLLGDATQDGKVNLRDATLCQQAAVGTKTLKGNALLAADVNDDSKVTTIDAFAIQKYDINLDTGYDIGKKVEK